MSITAAPIATASQLGSKPFVKYESTLVIARSPEEVTPKKLSSCPRAIMRAMPDVNPVITDDGI